MKMSIKRICSFLMMISMIFTFYLPVSAATRVDGFEAGSLYDHFHLGQSQDPDDLTVTPGDEIRIPLTADMFTYSDGKVPIYMEAITFSQLSRVRVRTRVRSGSSVLDYVQFDQDYFDGKPFIQSGGTTFSGKTAYISVKFAKEFVSVEDKDFAFSIYLSINGKPYYDELSIDLAGTMKVTTEQVDKSTERIDLSEGLVAEAEENIQGICLDLGSGLQVYTNMFEGQKYCGVAKVLEGVDAYLADRELTMLEIEEVDLPNLYTDIVMVYKVQSVGLNRPSTSVKIDKEADEIFYADRTYHVYDEDLRYIGVIGDSFPYSDYYFVTGERIAQFDALPVNQ